MFVKPKKGYKIPDPVMNDRLPEDGREVADSGYWQRLLRDGDVELVPDAKSKSEPTTKVK